MDNKFHKDFDELEPRVTPQPTVLKCTTAPSVPEVSLIYGKCSSSQQLPKNLGATSPEDYTTYASWNLRRNSRIAAASPVLSNRISIHERYIKKNCVTVENTVATDRNSYNDSPLSREASTVQYALHSNTATGEPSSEVSKRYNTGENFDQRIHENPSQNEFPASPSLKHKSIKTPTQNCPIKSILKNPSLDRPEISNQRSQYATVNSQDANFEKNVSHTGPCPSRSHANDCEYCPQYVPQCNRQHETSHDQVMVRDLLMLVRNQSEQIKSLQTQVERLLQVHEPNIHANTLEKFVQSSCDGHADSSKSSRYHGDQLRNTIVEKKVSIGVMTSFEFSVHNNPFVPDTDNQINAVLRECGKNITEPSENWRMNIHNSRNIAPEPLENINEDSESHPSSYSKQSNDNTRASLTANVNENRSDGQERRGGTAITRLNKSTIPTNKSNDENSPTTLYQNKPVTVTESPTARNNSSPTGTHERLLLKQNDNNIGQKFPDSDALEHKTYDSHRVNYNRKNSLESSDNREKDKNSAPRNFDRSKYDAVSIPTEERIDDSSLVLNTSDLRVTERSMPSPDPSIHVDMREYSSDDDTEKSKRAPPVGWTFYNNVVGQVNRILHAMPHTQDLETNENVDPRMLQRELDGCDNIVDSVKLATIERLKILGISFADHSEFQDEHIQRKVTFDSSYYPCLDCQITVPQATNAITETNTSMHMKALALKYLSDEQLADLAVQNQGNGPATKNKNIGNVHSTNMSMATMNYLQRYCLATGTNSPHNEGKAHVSPMRQQKLKHAVKDLRPQSPARASRLSNSTINRDPDKILDITTLKQQPKLL